MSSIIKIKRSEVAGNPSVLGSGELAYSSLLDNGSNGGDRLYVGVGTETAGNAVNHVVIGGKFFTDRLDHTAGTLTALSAIVVDANLKIDILNVDNITLNGNTISSTNTNGDLNITPNGTGKLVLTNPFIGDTSTSLTEFIQDVTGEQLVSSTGSIDINYNDTAGTTNIGLNVEFAQDLVGTMFSGAHFGLTATYDDPNGIITLDVNDPIITISGDVDGSATMTNLGNTTINVTLDTVNANVGTFGSTSAIPVITVNNKGLVTAVTTAPITTSLSIASDDGADTIALATDTLTFAGGEGIDTSINATTNTITISGEDATTTNKGIASFDTNDFNVTSGAVELKDTVVKSLTTDSGALTPSNHALSILGGEGIDVTHAGTTITVLGEDASTSNKGVASFESSNFTVVAGAVSTNDITLGSSTLNNGFTTSSIAGLTFIEVGNIFLDGNSISSTNVDGNISLNPNGAGVVAVNNSRVTGLADPVDDQDAATKAYVDARAAGLDPKQSVRAATTGPITLSGTQTIDDVVLVDGDRLLVKDQVDNTQNGIYIVASGAWARSTDMDEPSELTAGLFFFVESGTLNANAGFVKSSDSVGVVGTDPITFVQFSGAGQIIAGEALSKTGNQLDVVVAADGGIEISADALQLKSSLAGGGLSYSAGVLTVGGTTNRITVGATSVDIASTYIGQTSITTLGTISVGTWQGTVINPTYGGTGVNNGSSTITIGGNFAMSGAHTFTGTLTGDTAVTFPTTGTLATLVGSETISNKVITNSSIGSVNPSTAAFTTLSASGLVTFTNGTEASNLSTAAVVLSGGLAVNKDIRAGGDIVGTGAATSDISGFTIDGGTY